MHEDKSHDPSRNLNPQKRPASDGNAIVDPRKKKSDALIDQLERRENEKSVQVAKSSLMTRRRIPPNFVKEILIPHLERFIFEAKTCPPWYLMEVVVAYSQMPVINKFLSNILADTVILRLTDYTGPDFVKMLFPFYRLRPTDLTLFAHFSVELEEHYYELTTLHLIGVTRVYAKLQKNEQQLAFLEEMVIPRLQTDMARYDTEELSALLVSLASAPQMDTLSDVPLLAAIIPQIEKRYDETPLLTTIVNLNALCRLRVYHQRLIDLVSRDLSDRWRIRNIPPKYIAVAIWTFGQFNKLSRIFPAFEELILDNLHQFTAREYARFSQVLPSNSRILLNLTLMLLEGLPEMSRDHFLFFAAGIIRCGLFPLERGDDVHIQHNPGRTRGSASPASVRDNDMDELGTKHPFENKEPLKPFYHLHTPPVVAHSFSGVPGLREALQQHDETLKEKKKKKKVLTKDEESEVGSTMDGSRDFDHVAGGDHHESNDEEEQHDDDGSNDRNDGVGNDDNDGAADFQSPPRSYYIPKESILHECVEYCDTFEDEFEVDEIQRLAYLLRYHPQYSYISTLLPTSWESIINEVMFMGK